MPIDLHELRCAGCGYLIQLQGQTWVHCAGMVRQCPPENDPDRIAHPDHLEVAWHQFSNGSESYTLVHEGVEYVVWQHGPGPSWSAWRVAVALHTVGYTEALDPELTFYTVERRRHMSDPRLLLAEMPPLVAYWITEAVFPY